MVGAVGVTMAMGLAAPVNGVAQQARQELDEGTRARVAEAAAEALEASYVHPEVGRRLAELLRRGADNDAWSDATTPAELARRLTADMAGVAHDLHLRVEAPAPGTASGGPAGPGRRVVRVGPGDAGGPPPGAGARPVRVVRRGEPGAGSAPVPARRGARLAPGLPTSFRLPGGEGAPALEELPPGMRAQVEAERRENHGFRSAEVLPGNVGYLDLDRFPIMPYAAPAADAAMEFLAEVEAFVLDLRGNPGGGEGMNQYLGSFFFADSVHLYSRYYRPADETREYWTLPGLPPVTLADVPLFVLVDGRSGSAAENMAFNLSRAGRATVVGETTAGAGHSSTSADLPDGFTMVVPIARVFDPRTGEGFEGTGVVPDVGVPSGEALLAAHGLAVEALLARAGDPRRAEELEQARALFAARSAPPLPAGELEAYAGAYGNRRIRVAEGHLTLRRTDVPDAPELALLRTGPDRFVLEAMPEVRVEFVRDAAGTVTAIRVQQPNGAWEESPRG